MLVVFAVALQWWHFENVGIRYCRIYDGLAMARTGQAVCAEWSAPVGRKVNWSGTKWTGE